jgi:hypothetical protein
MFTEVLLWWWRMHALPKLLSEGGFEPVYENRAARADVVSVRAVLWALGPDVGSHAAQILPRYELPAWSHATARGLGILDTPFGR